MRAHSPRPIRLWQRIKSRPSIPRLVGAALIWIFLWGDFSLGNLLAGLVLGWLVGVLLPLPRIPMHRPAFRPAAVVRLVVIFFRDLVVAAASIAWFAITNRTPRGGVIRVQLHAHSDVFLTATAGMVSLVPGSIVIDVHRFTGILYLHVFDMDLSGGLEGAHDLAIKQEERLLRAFGTKEELLDAGYVPGASPKLGRLPEQQPSPAGGEQA